MKEKETLLDLKNGVWSHLMENFIQKMIYCCFFVLAIFVSEAEGICAGSAALFGLE